MFLDTTAFNLQGAGTNIRLDPVPDVCPRCHRSVHPKETYIALLAERALFQAIYRCTHQSCQEAFVATYKAGGSAGGRPVFVLANTAPIAPRPTAFPSDVATLSPTFVDIHGQVDSAEAAHLSQLVGIGLRKALEFLVKDYAIYKNPSHVDAIRKAPLAKCI